MFNTILPFARRRMKLDCYFMSVRTTYLTITEIILCFRHFESMTCTLLDTYYKTSKDMTERVLWNKQPLWNDQTLIEMARGIGLQFFLKKKACGSSQEKAWKKVSIEIVLYLLATFVLIHLIANSCPNFFSLHLNIAFCH